MKEISLMETRQEKEFEVFYRRNRRSGPRRWEVRRSERY